MFAAIDNHEQLNSTSLSPMQNRSLHTDITTRAGRRGWLSSFVDKVENFAEKSVDVVVSVAQIGVGLVAKTVNRILSKTIIGIGKIVNTISKLPVIKIIPIPRDFIASVTAKAVKITNKLVSKASVFVVLKLQKLKVSLIGKKPVPSTYTPSTAQQPASPPPPLPTATSSYSSPEKFSCLASENATAAATSGDGEYAARDPPGRRRSCANRDASVGRHRLHLRAQLLSQHFRVPRSPSGRQGESLLRRISGRPCCRLPLVFCPAMD